MNALELKVPPPLVMLVLASAMWAFARLTPTFAVAAQVRFSVAVAIALIGGAVSLAGLTAFRRARTTLNPLRPETSSSLVTSGIYRVTRNPMYVGMLFALVGWAVFLCAPWALVGPVLFVGYITRFQITPEERALSAGFGDQYALYRATVRRWL